MVNKVSNSIAVLGLAGVLGLAPAFGQSCPPHVKLNAPIGKVADLPWDGTLVFRMDEGADAGFLFTTRLKSSAPKKIAGSLGLGRFSFSPDGKWVLGKFKGTKTLGMVKADGSKVVDLGITCELPSWYYSSPMEDVKAGIYEIAWADLSRTSASAQKIDLSGAEPKLVGQPRKIAEGLPSGGYEEFDVAADIIVWDTRSFGNGSSVLYTIPENGRGKASSTTLYKSYAGANCASQINYSGSIWGVNQGGKSYDPPKTPGNCYMGSTGGNGHCGFWFRQTKRNTDPLPPNFNAYLLEPAWGSLSINWVPTKVENFNVRDDVSSPSFEWFMNGWTNHDDYVTCCVARKTTTGPAGVWLLNLKTNTYYPVTDIMKKAGEGVVSFDGQAYPPKVATALGDGFRKQGMAERNEIKFSSEARNYLGRKVRSDGMDADAQNRLRLIPGVE